MHTPMQTPLQTTQTPCAHAPPYPPVRLRLARGSKRRPCRSHSDTAALSLRSRPNAQLTGKDQHDGLQEDGNDLLIGMSVLIFNTVIRPIYRGRLPGVAARVIQRLFVLAGQSEPTEQPDESTAFLRALRWFDLPMCFPGFRCRRSNAA